MRPNRNRFNSNNNQKYNFNNNSKNNKNNFRNNDLNDQLNNNVNDNNNNNMKTPKVVNKIHLDENKRISKKSNYEFNENEFPSLNNKNNGQEESATVLSENQKKLIKNVNFLKQQVELFYKNENEERENNKSTKLSFKEVLEKPKDLVINENESKISRSRASSTNDLMAHNKDEEIKKKSKHKKRSKKKKTKETIERTNDTQEFKLNDDDFPGLNGDNNSRSGYSSSSKNVINLFRLFFFKIFIYSKY